jgi:hypothetical protein
MAPDIPIINNQTPRPITVKAAVISLLVCVILFIGTFASDIGLHEPLAYLVAFVFVDLILLNVWFIYKGKNWARWIFIVIVGIGLIPSILFFWRHLLFGLLLINY